MMRSAYPHTTGVKLAAAMLLAVLLSACTAIEADLLKARAEWADAAAVGAGGSANNVLALYSRAAELEPNSLRRGEIYGAMARRLETDGRLPEAYSAYEQGALLGDGAAAQELARHQIAGRYALQNASPVARAAYLPLSQKTKNARTSIALAELISNGTIAEDEFGSARQWLLVAERTGSNRAIRLLAEDAEFHGNIEVAASYYARRDSISPIERALRQARWHFKGDNGSRNLNATKSWMELAVKLDERRAGEVAAILYRRGKGRVLGDYLSRVAVLGGQPNPRANLPLAEKRSRRQSTNILTLSAQYAAASQQRRQQIIAPLIDRSNDGDINAALQLARIYSDTPDSTNRASLQYLRAYELGRSDLLGRARSLIASEPPGSPVVARFLRILALKADAGDVAAARTLSEFYAIGGPVSPDQGLSLKWRRKAIGSANLAARTEVGSPPLNRQ